MSIWTKTRSTLAVAALAAGCTTVFDEGDEGSHGDPNNPNDSSGTGGTSGDPSRDPSICVPGVPATSQLPRLTAVQYDNTIRDLLGLTSQPSSMLAPDTTGSVDQRAWDGYQLAAETLAAEVMANVAARAKVIPCSDDTTECVSQLVQQFGRRAFRRPLTAEETARFVALYTSRAEVTPNGTFDEAVELIINAFLLSPSFIMRAETSEVTEEAYYELSNYELATRLSYMLWSSMPDDALLDAAAGEPWTPEQILEHARRMLADPKARDMLRNFHQAWLRMGPGTRWENISRDPAIFSAFNESLVPLMSEETERFVEHVVFDMSGTFQQLITTPVGFVNAALAPLYGLDPAQFTSPDLVPYDLDVNTRSGIFTRLGFLASHSSYDRTSPILRGAFIQKEILCTTIPAPPPGAEGTPLPTTADLDTNRKRVDAQTAPDGCATCHHEYINPTGFPFEAYDAIGASQVTERFSGVPLDTASSVPMGDGGVTVDVTGPVQLSQAIADAPEAHACYAKHWVEFAYQRTMNNQDACTVDDMTAKLANGDYTVLDMVADLTQSQSFRLRAVEAEVAP